MDALLVSVQIIIIFVLSLYRILIPLLVLSGSDFVHSLDTPSWVRVEGRLVRYLERQSMDQQVVTVDQFTAAMASIQEALASLRQEISGQQGRPPAVPQDETPHDSLPPPRPPPIPSAPQASPYVLHGHS